MSYLVRQGQIQPTDIPQGAGFEQAASTAPPPAGGLGLSQRPVFQSGYGPQSLGEAYQPVGRNQDQQTNFRQQFLERDKKTLEEAEDVDVNAGIHGNWTMENAKSMLHQWMQSNKIFNVDYKYSTIGPDHNRSFVAELGFYVNKLGRNINAREAGSNKQSASKSCALSLVRQLFHLGVIEAFSGTLKKNKDVEELPPYDVALAPEIISQLNDCLKAGSYVPVDVSQGEAQESLSLITDSSSLDNLLPETRPLEAGVVSWSPPQPNWNPWQGCNIDEGPLANANMDQISEDLNSNWSERNKTDLDIQASLKARSTLPIFALKDEIMNTIHENPVVLIRGNTGCGKTTQVCQFILDDYISSGQGAFCNVICTQPRRISAVSVADRVASERCEDVS